MKNLISMEDYVLESKNKDDWEFRNEAIKYAQLLKSKPTLGQFVPTDDEGNVLKEPKGEYCCSGIMNDCACHGQLQYDEEYLEQYQTALEKVIFDGWSIDTRVQFATFLIDKYNNQIIFYSDGMVACNQRVVTSISDLTSYNLKLK